MAQVWFGKPRGVVILQFAFYSLVQLKTIRLILAIVAYLGEKSHLIPYTTVE